MRMKLDVYCSTGVSTPNTYLKPRSYTAWAAAWATTIGILYFSVTAVTAIVTPLEYGPSSNLMPSSLIIRS